MRSFPRLWWLAAVVAVIGFSGVPARAVMFYSTGSSSFNTTAPTGALLDSGWQYQGTFGNFLGTPIAPQYFITAGHIGGSIGQTFTIDGGLYTTTGFTDDPNSDLRIWKISGTFAPQYIAPLYTGTTPTGEDLVVFGRGTQRGADVNHPGLRGWLWGTEDHVQRWGTNTIEGSVSGGAGLGQLLYATFDAGVGGSESMLSVGDSGGAVFIDDGGTWKLAGINYGVSGPYSESSSGTNAFNAALFNENGYYVYNGTTWVSTSGPGAFYATNIAANAAFINSVIPEPTAVALILIGGAVFLTVSRREQKA